MSNTQYAVCHLQRGSGNDSGMSCHIERKDAVNLVKAREFSVEKAADREFKRSIPDVRAAMHIMNYRVQYPVTIQDQDCLLYTSRCV